MSYLNISGDTELERKIFKLKRPSENGLLVSLNNQTVNKKSQRFIHCDHQNNGVILALANNISQIYLINLQHGKYWYLKQVDTYINCIKFSETNQDHLIIGKYNGTLDILNINLGVTVAKLIGHEYPVNSISFAEKNLCLSASEYEALIWDLNNFSKLQVLSLDKQECTLKFACYIPVSNNILICYHDDVIQIWENYSFKSLKQFLPSNWRNYAVKSITFSKNGKIMIVGGYLPILAIFQLDIWKLLKIIHLPDYISTVRKVLFIPQNFDGGNNKLLAILSGNGILFFYDIEENNLLSFLQCQSEICNCFMASINAQYISCLLCTGEIQIYDLTSFTTSNTNTEIIKAKHPDDFAYGRKVKFKKSPKFIDKPAKDNEAEQILEIDKLKSIIKQYKEFPAKYRIVIWEKCLKLPNNIHHYNSIVNHVTVVAFNDLYTKFPLEDKTSLCCLKHLLNNIVTWCPFFSHIDYLPCFVYPFVKVFHKKPVACFELCCTVIINWCQHWFEYFPLLPLNILAAIDNVIIEHEPDLLRHFYSHNFKLNTYFWSLLETAFSEVFTTNQWLQFWDHVFINEPAFLLCAVASYILLQSKQLRLLINENELNQFFHSQRPIDIKKFLNKTYHILNSTTERNHPRQYLKPFTCLICDIYPVFEQYPKDIVSFQTEQITNLDHQLKEIHNLKDSITKQKIGQNTFSDMDIRSEEERRKLEMEKACIEKIKTYQDSLRFQQEELKLMRDALLNSEKHILNSTQKKLQKNMAEKYQNTLKILLDDLSVKEKMNKTELGILEDSFKQQHLNILRKTQNFNADSNPENRNVEIENALSSARRETANLKENIKKAKNDLQSSNNDVILIISTLNKLMKDIKLELNQRSDATDSNNAIANLKVHQLEKETKQLHKKIARLLRLLCANTN